MPMIYGSDFGVNIPEEEFNHEIAQREYENYIMSLTQAYEEAMEEEYNEAMAQEYQECISAIDEEITEGVPDGYVRGIVQEYINAIAGEAPTITYEDHCTTPRSPQEENNALREQWQYETERQQYEERWRRYERSVREYLETINRLNRDTVEVPPSRARESPPERKRRLAELAERYGGEEELNY